MLPGATVEEDADEAGLVGGEPVEAPEPAQAVSASREANPTATANCRGLDVIPGKHSGDRLSYARSGTTLGAAPKTRRSISAVLSIAAWRAGRENGGQ
jgi:hypothetical protein